MRYSKQKIFRMLTAQEKRTILARHDKVVKGYRARRIQLLPTLKKTLREERGKEITLFIFTKLFTYFIQHNLLLILLAIFINIFSRITKSIKVIQLLSYNKSIIE